MTYDPSFSEITFAAAEALAGEAGADFAIYLPPRVGGNPVLYREEASGLSLPDFERIRNAGVSGLFVHNQDTDKCDRILESKLGQLIQSPDVPAGEKANILHSVGGMIAQDLMTEGARSCDLERSSAFVDNLVAGLLDDPAVAGHILRMVQHERSTASHMVIVSALATILRTEAYGADSDMLADLALAGLLHDMGKLSISSEVLGKSERLTREEVLLIQQHPVESVRLIETDPRVSLEVKQYILQHHERPDGRGYPIGIAGADLLPSARVLSIVDSFHAMIGRRSYRRTLTAPEAIRLIEMHAGQQFDRDLVHCWASIFGKHWAAGPRKKADPNRSQGEEHSSRREHSSLQAPKATAPRPARLICDGRAAIKCIYAGRLANASNALNEFMAPLYDLSRGGLCIYAPQPTYRGEVLHVRISSEHGEVWVRGTVMWCRHLRGQVYKTGMRFLERISETQARMKVPVKSMHEMAELDAAKLRARGSVNIGSHVDSRKAESPKRGALDSLRKIAALPMMSPDDERTIMTLSMSGDSEVRVQSIELLKTIQTKPANDALLHLLEDADPAVRHHALSAVAELRLTKSIGLLERLTHDPDETVAVQARQVVNGFAADVSPE